MCLQSWQAQQKTEASKPCKPINLQQLRKLHREARMKYCENQKTQLCRALLDNLLTTKNSDACLYSAWRGMHAVILFSDKLSVLQARLVLLRSQASNDLMVKTPHGRHGGQDQAIPNELGP